MPEYGWRLQPIQRPDTHFFTLRTTNDRGIQKQDCRYIGRGQILSKLRRQLMHRDHSQIITPAPFFKHSGKDRTGAIIPAQRISITDQQYHRSPGNQRRQRISATRKLLHHTAVGSYDPDHQRHPSDSMG